MPSIAEFHPHLVHFVIALGFVGILLRILSLAGRGAWLNPAAAALIILSAGTSIAAARAGTDAHGPAERVPGAREAVQEHEQWGNRSRNLLIVMAGLEMLVLIWSSHRAGRVLRLVSAGTGLVAGFFLYEAGEHGGELVYKYAGGVGIRSGDPADVSNLLVAALYHNARLDRDSGRVEDAARLTDELARLRPDDPAVKFLVIESKLRDRKDPAGALAELGTMQVAPDDARLAPRHGLLTAEAHVAAGHSDSAKVVLTALAERFPNNRAVKDALAKLP
jgi:uncharacterized membrane protein